MRFGDVVVEEVPISDEETRLHECGGRCRPAGRSPLGQDGTLRARPAPARRSLPGSPPVTTLLMAGGDGGVFAKRMTL